MKKNPTRTEIRTEVIKRAEAKGMVKMAGHDNTWVPNKEMVAAYEIIHIPRQADVLSKKTWLLILSQIERV